MTVHLSFSLDVEDGWPPLAVECLPFRVESEGFVSLVPPLFVKGLSVGDVIAVTYEDEEQTRVLEWSHVSKSGTSTVWLLRMRETAEIDAVLRELHAMGCESTSLEQVGAFSISVPPSVTLPAVDAILDRLNPESVAVAFPSLRHAED